MFATSGSAILAWDSLGVMRRSIFLSRSHVMMSLSIEELFLPWREIINLMISFKVRTKCG
jgi:hypothetical protein